MFIYLLYLAEFAAPKSQTLINLSWNRTMEVFLVANSIMSSNTMKRRRVLRSKRRLILSSLTLINSIISIVTYLHDRFEYDNINPDISWINQNWTRSDVERRCAESLYSPETVLLMPDRISCSTSDRLLACNWKWNSYEVCV